MNISGFPSRTISITCTNVPQSIPDPQFTQGGRPVIAMLLSCEDNGIRFTFGDADPDIGNQVGHTLYPGYDFVRLENSAMVRTFQVCNAITDLTAVAHITLEFERSVL